MRRYKARALMQASPEAMWTMADERFILEFDNGEIQTTTRRTLYSYYHWEVHRQYPSIPLNVEHHMGNAPLSADTSLDILSACARDLHEQYRDSIDHERVWKLFYEISNEIYNVFSVKLDAYQTSSNILDYLEIFDHPEIAHANANVKNTQQSLDTTYRAIGKVMHEDQSLSHNPVARAVRSKLVKLDQINQIVGPRGFLTDADSTVFSTAIKQGFLEGITGLAESMIESRSAVKALTFTKKPLRQVEYFNRKMRLSSANVKDLIMGDCGSDQFIELKVSEALLKKGLEGKYYVTNLRDNQPLKAFSSRDKDLLGKVIYTRSPLKCHYRGGGACCMTCMGEIAFSIPRMTNLGHVSSTEMCQEGSQLVLSVKHYDGSSNVEPVSISDSDKRFIFEGEKPGTLFFKPGLKKHNFAIIMDSEAKPPLEGASGLATLERDADVENRSVHRITSFHSVDVVWTNEQGFEEQSYINVSEGGRLGSLSTEFLKYVMQVGYTITNEGKFRVELNQWDFTQPAFKLPLRHLNMLDYMSDIEVFLRSPSEASRDERLGIVKKLYSYKRLDEALLDLYELASSKLSVNLAHLEVLLVSLMRSTEPNDYRIPPLQEVDSFMFERHSKLMEMRSLGAAMAYERQPAIIEDVDSYLVTNRDPHILDPLLI